MKQSKEHLLACRTGPEKEFTREHSLQYDALHNCVISEWRGFVSKQMLMEGALKSLRLLKESYSTGLLVDHCRVHGTWADMSDWQQHIWLPNAKSAGLKKYALVANTGSYSALVMELSFGTLNADFEMMIFSDISDAKSWLAGF